MRCAICDHVIQPAVEPIFSTTMGELLHVSCANRDDQRAYLWRTCRAAASAGIAIGLLALAISAEGSDVVLLGLLLVLTVAHVRFYERWWHLTVLSARQRWR